MNAPVPKNPPPLPAGMDNPWYDYSPFPLRPKLAWPRNARVASFVLLHLEYWELLPDETSYKDPRYVGEYGSFVPDYRTWTQREYGNRIGIFRVLDVLDRYQIRAGVAVNALAAERYPFLIEQFKKRKYEFIAHGHSANRMITSKMSEAEEKAEIAMVHGGRAWRGWFGVGDELTDGVPDRKEGLYFGTELGPGDPRVAAGTRGHGDQAIGALLHGLAREPVVDDVVKHHAAVTMHGLVHVFTRAQRGDDHRHLVLDAHLEVVLEPVVALVHDLVDGERRGRLIGVRAVVRVQRLGDLGQPFVELGGRSGVERGHRADHASLALGDHQLRVADDEHR